MGSRKPCSSLAKHTIKTEHRINIDTAFKTLHKNFQGQFLKFIETLVIRNFKLLFMCSEIVCYNHEFDAVILMRFWGLALCNNFVFLPTLY